MHDNYVLHGDGIYTLYLGVGIMSENFESKLKQFKEYLTNIEYLSSANSVLYWDMRVGIPKKAIRTLINGKEKVAYMAQRYLLAS